MRMPTRPGPATFAIASSLSLIHILLKDLPGAKNLTLNASFRYSDYSNSNVGGKQSYNYGLSYTPIEDITFRAVNSVAIRAPDLSDLYQGRGESADVYKRQRLS